jgi:hypothetical protein
MSLDYFTNLFAPISSPCSSYAILNSSFPFIISLELSTVWLS